MNAQSLFSCSLACHTSCNDNIFRFFKFIIFPTTVREVVPGSYADRCYYKLTIVTSGARLPFFSSGYLHAYLILGYFAFGIYCFGYITSFFFIRLHFWCYTS